MRETDLPFFRLEMEYSKRWAEHFRKARLSTQTQEKLDQASRQSLIDQADIERADSIDFSQYLAEFYAQYDVL